MNKKHSFAVLSFLRKQGSRNTGNATVYIRITADGCRTEISTKITISQSKWDANKGRVKGTNADSKRLKWWYRQFRAPDSRNLQSFYRTRQSYYGRLHKKQVIWL
jgi:hypothetical protein